jgi:hypothetical protein
MKDDRKTESLPESIEHWKQLKDSEYIGHWDLPKTGSYKVVISAIRYETVMNPGSFKEEKKVVAEFKNAKKKLILNETNKAAIASWHGNNPKEWLGKDVELYRTTTRAKGDTVECIRIKANTEKMSRDRVASKANAAMDAAVNAGKK